ncbi:hypothetical protein TIFTF001_024519 [Ficus carica]|uniref:Rho termination factor N-terminal domain-containing protein n=1 Tax=Ficus carica TaxID=3494 RepID=A0AA88AM72_FICCA|nr:hypothetical protein TIFTF001_024519 [Ficus carica]
MLSLVKLLCSMAWGLWELPLDQDTPAEGDSMHSGCQCDFYFGNGHDVIEESILHEESCIQVLRILISKANTEIDELEKTLVSLRTELAFAEDKECSKLCCNSLRDKIHSLEISIRSLRNMCEKDDEFQSSILGEPAETIHDLVKGLLSRLFQEKNKQNQPSQVTILDLKSDDTADSSELCENGEPRQLKSDITKEETRELDTPTDRCTSTNSSSNFQEKTNCPNTKPAETNTPCSNQDCLRRAPGSSDVGKKLVMSEAMGITEQWKTIEQELSFADENATENASSKPKEKNSEIEVAKTAKAIVKASSSGSRESSDTSLSVGKSLCKTGLKSTGNVKVNGVRKQHHLAIEDSHPEGNQAREKTTERSNAIVNYIGPDALIELAALKAMNKTSEFKASSLSPAKTVNCDMDQKLIDIKRAARKEVFKDSKVFVLNKFNSSNPWSKTVMNNRDDLQVVTNTTHLALSLQAQFGKTIIKAEPVLEEPINEVSNKAVVLYDKSQLNSGQQPQSRRTKRKFQSDSRSIIGHIFRNQDSKLNASSISTFKRLKADADDDNASLKKLMSGKHLRPALLECQNKDNGTSLAIVEYLFSQPLESKGTANLPLGAHMKDSSINLNFSDSNRHAAQSGSVNYDPQSKPLVQLPTADERLLEKLRKLKLTELKAIARDCKLKSYSKLKKGPLIQFLAEQLGHQVFR